MVVARVGERENKVDCLLDPGCQVICCSKAVCLALGFAYDPTIALNMESANGEINLTLGLARNVPFHFGDITVYCQVHVVRHAAFDMLMRRPFDVLTFSIVRAQLQQRKSDNHDTLPELWSRQYHSDATTSTSQVLPQLGFSPIDESGDFQGDLESDRDLLRFLNL